MQVAWVAICPSQPARSLMAIGELPEKLSPRLAVTVFIVTSLLILAPLRLPGRFAWIEAVMREHKTAIGMTMLGSGALSLTYGVSAFWSLVAKRRESHRQVKQ